MLGFTRILLGISSLLLGIYVLHTFMVCICTVEVGKGLMGISWDGAQKTGVDGNPRSCRDTSGDEESPGFGDGGQCGLSFANLGPLGQKQQSHKVSTSDPNPKSSTKWENTGFPQVLDAGEEI